MSGVKRTYVSVDQTAWAEAQRAAARLRDVRRDLPRMVEGVREQARRDAQAAIRPVEERARAAERQIAKLSARARRFERETQVRLARQRQDLAGLRTDTENAFAAQERQFRAAIQAERAARQKAVDELRADVDALRDERSRARDAAREWIADAEGLATLIRDTLASERFRPGRLAGLERDVATARQNVANGFGEAALTAAQRAYDGLSDLRYELEVSDREWHAARDAANEALLLVGRIAQEQAVQPVLDEDGRPMADVTLDVDHWSNGELAALRAEVETLLAEVRDDSPGVGPRAGREVATREVTTDELREIVEERAPELEARLADIVERAALNQLGSQLRVNVADVVVQTLVNNGFALADHTYAGEDDRNAFFARVTHPDGGVVVVDVSPAETAPACDLKILSYDEVGAENIRLARAEELAAALRARGLEAAAPRVDAAPPDESLHHDLDPVRYAPPATPARPVPLATPVARPR